MSAIVKMYKSVDEALEAISKMELKRKKTKTIKIISISGQSIRYNKKDISFGVRANICGGDDYFIFSGKTAAAQVNKQELLRVKQELELSK